MKTYLISACLLGCACRYDGESRPQPQALALLERPDIRLIPVCPEQLGGLSTPRVPAERQGSRVVTREGVDVTAEYRRGSAEVLRLARSFRAHGAILRARSPACGVGQIYDGSFTKTLVSGNGVAAEALLKAGIPVWPETLPEDAGPERQGAS